FAGNDFLPCFYQDWVFPEQQRLEELHFQALHQLIATLEQANRIDEALQFALQSVTANRFREEAHRELMRLQLVAGRPEAAQRQYRELERLLREELECEPSGPTQALLHQIQQLGSVPGPRDGIQANVVTKKATFAGSGGGLMGERSEAVHPLE